MRHRTVLSGGTKNSLSVIDKVVITDIVQPSVGDSGLLKKYQSELVQYIDLPSLIPYLNRHNLLTDDEQEMLLNTQFTERERILKLLALVEKKGKDGFESFLKALEEEPEHIGHKELMILLIGASITGEAQNCIIGWYHYQ